MSVESGPSGAGAKSAVRARTPQLGRDDFARLYAEHWRLLWCAAMGVVGDRSLAQDCVQQSALIGLQRLDTFDPATSFTAWMSTIVRNTALNEFRKRGRRRTSPAENGTLERASAPSSSTPQHATPFDDRLLHALETLEETPRTCILMRVVGDMSYKQIALALAIPEGTAASHVHRARLSLRDSLRGPGGIGVSVPSDRVRSGS